MQQFVRGIALAAAALAFTAVQASVTRYECRLVNGEYAVVPQDLSEVYGRAAASCVPFKAQAAPPPSIPAMPLPETVALNREIASGTSLRSPYASLIRETAQRYRLDPRLLAAIMQVESNHQARARSRAGAVGLMQVMPATGARYGVYQTQNLFEPSVNVDVAARYLSDLLDQFRGSLVLSLAAYNAGENAVVRYGNRVPPFPETQAYVRRVLRLIGQGARG